MLKPKYVLSSEKLNKTNKQVNDVQDQFSLKNKNKNTKQKQTKKPPNKKTITPPKQLQTQTFFPASSTPSMGPRFFQRAQLPFMVLNTGQIFINAQNLMFRAVSTSGH